MRQFKFRHLLSQIVWINKKFSLLFFIFIIIMSPLSIQYAQTNEPYQLSETEKEYIEEHKSEVLKLSLDPYTGMDYFKVDGQTKGYLIDFLGYMEKDLGLKIEIVDTLSWSQVLNSLQEGKIDIIFGANVTPDRLKSMAFTVPLYEYPYSVYALKTSTVKTIGDLDRKTVGFLEGDLMSGAFPSLYGNISIATRKYDDQLTGLKAVLSGDVDAFITANGGITKQFVHQYPNLTAIADVKTFTSEMTLSTLRKNQVLCGLMDKVIEHRKENIENDIQHAEKNFNLTILNLTKEERAWLESQPTIRVGAALDYLPFDYYKNGVYKGIAGNLFTAISDQIGLKIEVVSAPFDTLYEQMERGELDVLNMAKTEEREEKYLFTKAFSEERDQIYGRRELPYIQDIYELEGAKVAVVKGYWHKDYLVKNLSEVTIIDTIDLKESLKFIDQGKADYLIENPTVAQYYIDGLGYSGIIQKGNTSQDSFLYFGVNKKKNLLPSIINKSLGLLDYERVKSAALMEIPGQQNVVTKKLKNLLVISGLILVVLTLFVFRLIKEVINNRARQSFLEQREKLIFRDGLTGLYNRMYFNHIENDLNKEIFPQYFIMTDLNGLKHVNDTYGHAAGDQLIMAYTRALEESFGEAILIRMGGDEFLVIALGWNVQDLERQLNHLEKRCQLNQFEMERGIWIKPQAAVGWERRDSEKVTVNEAIVHADQMMYQHKSRLKRRKSD